MRLPALRSAPITTLPRLREPPAPDSRDRSDDAVPEVQEMPGREVAGALVVRAYGHDVAPFDVVDAHGGEGVVENVAEGAVLLHLRCRKEDAVDASFHHRGQRV